MVNAYPMQKYLGRVTIRIFTVMRSIFLRRISLILASWLMVTSVGASIDVHFCKGEIYSIGVNASADVCYENGYDNETERKAGIANSPCCDQFSAYFQSDVDSANDVVAIQYSFHSFILPFQHEVRIPNCVEPIQLCHFYHPPEYEADFQTLYSVFRI